jgi:hypothetical protein
MDDRFTRRAGARIASLAAAVLAAALLTAGCEGTSTEYSYPEKVDRNTYDPVGSNKPRETVFGPGGLTFGGGAKRPGEAEGGGGIGVNSFLWRASLDTIAFMPLASADPFGGVIITEWYSPAQTPNERFKITVYILDRALRADGIKVAVFRQVRRGPDQWADEAVAADTAASLENAILTRARQLRIDQAGL